ncbi:MAG: hypothetical protein V1926_04420, partial [Candidatus Peregrinibacteria bacterium]
MTPPPPALRSVDEMRNFLASASKNTPVRTPRGQGKIISDHVLTDIHYDSLSRDEKGVVRAYLQAALGCSRAQVARFVARHRTIAHDAEMHAGSPIAHRVRTWLPAGAVLTLLLLMGGGMIINRGDALRFLSGETMQAWRLDQLARVLPTSLRTSEKNGALSQTVSVHTVLPGSTGTEAPLFTRQEEIEKNGSLVLERTTLSQNGSELVTVTGAQQAAALASLLSNSTRPRTVGTSQPSPGLTASEQAFVGRVSLYSNAFLLSTKAEERRKARLAARPADSLFHGAAQKPGQSEWAWVGTPTTVALSPATTMWDVAGPGVEGQVLMIENGKPSWKTLEERDIGNPEVGVGRKPVDPNGSGGGGSDGGGRRSGGGGGGGETTSTTTTTTTTIVNEANGWTDNGTSVVLTTATDLVGIGLSDPETALEIADTASGRALHAQDTLTSSGTLSVNGLVFLNNNTVVTGNLDTTGNVSGSGVLSIEGNASLQGDTTVKGSLSGNTLYVASTVVFDKFSTACTALELDINGNLVCGTDDTIGSGMDQTTGDARYVNTAGDTMTGGLLIHIGGTSAESIESGLAFEVSGSASGRSIHAQDLLTTSGSLIVEEGQTMRINGVTYTFPSGDGAASGRVLKTDSAGQLSWASDAGSSYYAGQGLALQGTNTFALNTTLTGSLIDFATVSGALVSAENRLTSSGTLSVDGLVYLNNNTAITGNFNATGNVSGSGVLSIDGATYLNSATTITGNLKTRGDMSGTTLNV